MGMMTEKMKILFQGKSGLFFLLSFCLIVGRTFVVFPSLTWRAQPYAETGNDFFIKAWEQGPLQNLMMTDFGYLNVLPRLMAVLVVDGLRVVEFYPMLVQIMAISLIAFFSSFLNLSLFRQYIPQDSLRFILSCLLGFHFGYGMFLLHNMGYFGVIFILGILALPPKTLVHFSRPIQFLLLGFICATVLGKPYFFVFFPLFLFRGYGEGKKRNYQKMIFYFLPLFCLTVQLLLVLKNRSQFIQPVPDAGLLPFLKGVFALYFYGYGNLLFGKVVDPTYAFFSSLLGIGGISYMVFHLWRRKEKSTLKAFALLQVLALLCFSLTVKVFYPQGVSLPPTFLDDSHVFFSFIFMMISTALLIAQTIRQLFLQLSLFLFIGATSNVFGFLKAHDPFAKAEHSHSQWRIYHSF